MRAKNKEDQSASSKEINRFIVDTKRKIVYTLFYKYRYQVDDKLILFESYHGEQYAIPEAFMRRFFRMNGILIINLYGP